MDEPARWLDRDRTANYICVRVYQLRRLVKSGKIPTPSYHLGPRLPRWDRIALDAAMAASLASVGSTDADVAFEALCKDLLNRPQRRRQAADEAGNQFAAADIKSKLEPE